MKTFNLYCDESCHLENDKMPYMLMGYICVPYNQLSDHKNYLYNLKKKHFLYGEIKWSKISKSSYEFHHDLIKYFFATDMKFRAVVVKKDKINNDAFNQDYDTFYYKMYYQLIHHKLNMEYSYNIYLDIKDTLSANKIRILKKILQTKYGVINNLQNINSKESIFLQLTDVLLGAISYHLRDLDKVISKKSLIKLIQKEANHSLEYSTSLSEDKLNLFFIELK